MSYRPGRFSLLLAATFLWAALPAFAGTLTGVVTDATTGHVAAGTTVTLIALQSTMEPVAHTTTDAQGHYTFTNAGIGTQSMLVRASFRGVDYLEPIAPGKSNVNIDIKVYDPTTKTSAFQVVHEMVVLEPHGNNLDVGVQFDIENQTKPPKSFFRPNGSFIFSLPKGVGLTQAEAWGPSGMPVKQSTTPKGNNQYAITFPFRPGQNGVRYSYQMNYASQEAVLHLRSLYPVQTAWIIAPPAMKIIGEGFSPAGNNQGWAVYSRTGLDANSAVALSVSGTGPIPKLPNSSSSASSAGSASSGSGGQGQAASGQSGSGSTITAVAQALPPRLDSVRWILIAGFGAMFLLGALFLWWRTRHELGPAVAGSASPVTAPVPTAIPEGSGEQVLRQNVDEIKETLFRLELRHQAGTLSEQEYLAQRQRMEKALRELVKG